MYRIRTAVPRGSHNRKRSMQVQLPSFRFPLPSVYGKTDIPRETSSEASNMQMQALPMEAVSAAQGSAADYTESDMPDSKKTNPSQVLPAVHNHCLRF